MSINWSNEDLARSMFGLVKSGGAFKSAKHMTFLRAGKMYAAWRRVHKSAADVDFFKSNFGIVDVALTDTIYQIDGDMAWANYGRKSQRRVEHIFVLDEFGVRAQYKLHFTYTGGGSSVNASKTEQIFARAENAPLIAFESPLVAAIEAGEFIGSEKQRLVFEGDIVFAMNTGYGPYGATYITVVKVGNNEVVYFGLLEQIDYRGPVKFKATVKKHNVRNGVNQTIVNRPAVLAN